MWELQDSQSKKWDDWLQNLINETLKVADKLNTVDKYTIQSAARELDYHRTSFTLKANQLPLELEIKNLKEELEKYRHFGRHPCQELAS